MFPDGQFDARDGRLGSIDGCVAKSWWLDAAIAAALTARANRFSPSNRVVGDWLAGGWPRFRLPWIRPPFSARYSPRCWYLGNRLATGYRHPAWEAHPWE